MDFVTLKKFIKYFIDDKKKLCLYFGLSFIVALLELTGVALVYPFINNLLKQDGFNLSIVLTGFFIVLAFIAKNLFMIFYTSLQINYKKDIQFSLTEKFFSYFVGASYLKVSQVSFPRKSHVMNFLIPTSIDNYLLRMLNIIVNLFVFAVLIAFLFVKFFVAALISILCAMILLVTQTALLKISTRKASQLASKANENVSRAFNEPLLNTKSVKIFNSEAYFVNNYRDALKTFQYYMSRISFYSAIPPYLTEPFTIILLMILLLIISLQSSDGSAELVASYAVIIAAAFRLTPTISRLQVNITGMQNFKPQVKELISLYEEYEVDKFVLNDAVELEPFEKEIELKNVDFSYSDKKVLNNVNLKINKGEFIGIVGESGVGKTTLADIIAGLLEIDSGQIYLDGKLLLTGLMPRLNIGYIPQDFSIISATIRENVAYSSSNIDDDKVIDALKKAQLYEFILNNFSKGIYENPFVDATGFSQGQKQRISIARALYRNPDILILDEATSSLDLKTEEEICEILNSLKSEKTVIAIAHRLSTIKTADRIVFMKNQTVQDIGTFMELYERNQDFRELVLLNNANSIH